MDRKVQRRDGLLRRALVFINPNADRRSYDLWRDIKSLLANPIKIRPRQMTPCDHWAIWEKVTGHLDRNQKNIAAQENAPLTINFVDLRRMMDRISDLTTIVTNMDALWQDGDA